LFPKEQTELPNSIAQLMFFVQQVELVANEGNSAANIRHIYLINSEDVSDRNPYAHIYGKVRGDFIILNVCVWARYSHLIVAMYSFATL
jgi:hypothetical protein